MLTFLILPLAVVVILASWDWAASPWGLTEFFDGETGETLCVVPVGHHGGRLLRSILRRRHPEVCWCDHADRDWTFRAFYQLRDGASPRPRP